ncbi:DUF2510 domain-containing protein [Microbacterium sp. HD4P20]|uniref:DUF2510 domain-containing protein n=1 Tax=Microbacterium sp. HD4P20 TaxID=2864874 RepID=UPI001C642845|nr:DUF2510 domain-containing protein [Microbacterium sp. HD4P20]MCP2636306.1 DUF2510 domain-containing protein [Microbacterium sp. HD4P20]
MKTTPPGWYDDGHGGLRWWDGAQWTEHVAQPDPEATDAPTEAEIVAASEAETNAEAQAEAQAGALAAGVDPAAVASAEVPSRAAGPGDQAPPASDPATELFGAQGAIPEQPATVGAVPPPGGVAQPGSPAGAAYPGADAGGGAFSAATESRTSKLWILWLVLGVVLLGIVIAAAVLIPLLFLNMATSGGSATTPDEQAAVAAVELYDDAWQNADCDALVTSTTEQFQADSGFADCAAFVAEAELFDQNFDEYTVAVDDVVAGEGEIVITTTESYVVVVDDQGNPTDPTPGEIVYHYTLVPDDGGWAIDGVSDE